jgi:hypothetical protein
MPNPTTAITETRLIGQLERAVEKLRATHVLDARIVAAEPQTTPTGNRPDATLEITVGTQQYRYAVEAKLRVDRAQALPQLKTRLEAYGERGLLFTRYITPTLADHCRDLDLQYLDDAGNAYLRAPGLYMFVKGQKLEDWTAAEKQGGGTATALRVAFALLNDRALLNAPQREIARIAHVALGAVGRVFADLETRGYITRGTEKQNRHFLEPARLFEEWVTNYPIRLRPKLNPRRFRAPIDQWWRHARLEPGKAWWGGEVAADRLTNYLKAANCTIYFDPAARVEGLNQLVRDHKLRADLNGDIEVLDAFWKLPLDPERPDVAPPMLVYADLAATLNPRNLEVAKLIGERFFNDDLRTP